MMATAQDKKTNPANDKLELPKGYKPMTGGQMRLETPELPGHHLHWFRGTPGRLAQARQAGYTHVRTDELDINNFDLAGDALSHGSTDLGSNISVVSGEGADESGQTPRMYLMKCPDYIWDYKNGLVEKQNADTADALNGGTVGKGGAGETGNDVGKRYTGTSNSLFKPK
jgi:hypothetical protein